MKVQELIEILARLNGDDEVCIATQPNYPLAFDVDGVAAAYANTHRACEWCDGLVEIINDEAHHLNRSLDGCHEPTVEDDATDLEPGVVWIVAGDHPEDSPYAPYEAWDACER